MDKWNKTILTVLLQWDYGKKERGESAEKLWFYNPFLKLVERVEAFWYDEYLDTPDKLQEVLLQKAAECKPDLIFFIPYQDQFTFETLDALKKLYPTVAWFGDDTWRFEGFSSRYATHFSHIATTDPASMSKYRKLGGNPILTEWAAAEPLSENIGPLSPKESYRYDVSFVGGKNPFRKWFIDMLGKQGVHVTCFGAGWPNGRISFEEMEQVFRFSKINLNISNSVCHDIRYIFSGLRPFKDYLRSNKTAEQVKARNFEIPLAGGFQLSNYVLGLERHLHIGTELALYNTPEDCVQQVCYYLENEDDRQKLLMRSHERALTEHTYFYRLGAIIQQIFNTDQ